VSVVFIALPIALLLALAALAAFIWSVRSGQMDDLETPRHRVLFDDEGFARDERPKDKNRK
jgi:cbb3-type cytochrome oxidase maturation protein